MLEEAEGLQSSRVDGLVERRVERRVEGVVVDPGRSARQDLLGARLVELREILCRVLRQDGLTIGIVR
jgi:hypothetical protein